MPLNYDEIIQVMDEHLNKSGKNYYNEFYIGITNNPERRLFEEHGVFKEDSWWIYIPADSVDTARKVKQHYLDKGMRGDSGGGDDDSIFVYCYIVTPTTVDK